MTPAPLDYATALHVPSTGPGAFFRPRLRAYLARALIVTGIGAAFLLAAAYGLCVAVLEASWANGDFIVFPAIAVFAVLGVACVWAGVGVLRDGQAAGVGYAADAVIVRDRAGTRAIGFAALARCDVRPDEVDGTATVRLFDRAGRRVELPGLAECPARDRAAFAAAVAAGIARANSRPGGEA